MNRLPVYIIAFALFFAAQNAMCQPEYAAQRNVITTEGTAEVAGQNDSAVIAIAVITEDRDLDDANSENNKKTKEVIAAVKKLGVKNLKLKTSGYRVTPQKDYKQRPPKIKGYQVYNAVQVTLEGLSADKLTGHVSEIIGKSLEKGANSIQNITFYIKDKSALEKEALKIAAKKAIDKANVLADAAGVKLKRIASLGTWPAYVPPETKMLRGVSVEGNSEAMAPPVESGESRVRVKVNLVYEIE